jgi:3-hydroxybutyryl-CoA dehydratase
LKINERTIDSLKEGDSFSFEETISEAQVDTFAALSGDVSPLHMDAEFARGRGFRGRVAHGVLTLAFFSRMVGVYLPGKYSLLEAMNVRFQAPVYPGDRILFSAEITQVSLENRAVVIQMKAINSATRQAVARGKIQVGLLGGGSEGI